MKTINVAIFVSGNGTNCANIIRYFKNSKSVKIKIVLSNRPIIFRNLETSRPESRNGIAQVCHG